jgi:hypothetical protein
MLRFVHGASVTGLLARLATCAIAFSLLGACSLDGAIDRVAGMQLAASPAGEPRTLLHAQMMPSLSISPGSDRALDQCRPPLTLCGATIKALEQGAFLDFRASPEGERAAPRLLSPFDVVRIHPLDRARCPAKLCAAHVALEGLLGDLLQEGYYAQSVALFPGSAMLTLRTERIGPDAKVLKGSCRFNLDPKCVDSTPGCSRTSARAVRGSRERAYSWRRSRPTSSAPPASPPRAAPPVAGVEALTRAFDATGAHVYELIVHKLCRNEMARWCATGDGDLGSGSPGQHSSGHENPQRTCTRAGTSVVLP